MAFGEVVGYYRYLLCRPNFCCQSSLKEFWGIGFVGEGCERFSSPKGGGDCGI